MFLMGIMVLIVSQRVWGSEDVSTGEIIGLEKSIQEGQEENPPGILFQGNKDSYEAGNPTDIPSIEVQTEVRTVVKEVVVEVEEPRKDAQIPSVARYEGQIKTGSNLDDTQCKGNDNYTFGRERCYILTKDVHDGDLSNISAFVEGQNGKIKRQYTKNVTGVSFCSNNENVMKKGSGIGMHIEEDKIYGVSAFQNSIPNYMYLMKYYENIIFNNYFYDNWIFRVLQIKRMMASFFGFYEYYHTGKGVSIFLLDTTVKPVNNVCNLSGRLESCNTHGDTMASLLVGRDTGFAKDSHLNVLDVVGCDGKVMLSDMIYGLESLESKGGPGILVFGVSGPYSEALNAVVDHISSRGMVVVTPAGNLHDQSCNYSPGSSKSVINVGSVNKYAGVSKFSNHGDCVRIFALGEEVLRENSAAGTSLSAAIVASSIALFLETSPRATFSQIWGYLNQNSFWNSRGSYNVLKIPRLECGSRSQRSIFHFWGFPSDVITIVFIFLAIFILSYLIFIGIRYFRRRGEAHEDSILFDPPMDRF
ncbi:subtilisin-like endopeptidase [Encephalitozoon intestinalis ATCC 50506]|uniref:Subtilisin-like endopeptidase n=1 Tax=Encephalitozoon intestinalis (strain ATCC 50506) TaxID=876142 RepID=E0S6B6_ENCIT|nr:subtilisin-like endopeptidase [Encephalitozoon intestinalis ATCC 50506]ADM11251.1 subtilisin-like endopeptidase [Encephalitozoon intestinalis ATCC 50506]